MKRLLMVVVVVLGAASCSGSDSNELTALRTENAALRAQLAALEENSMSAESSTTTQPASPTTLDELGSPGEPYAAGVPMALSSDTQRFSVTVLDTADLTEDVDTSLLGDDDPLAPRGLAAIGVLIRLSVNSDSEPLRPDIFSGSLMVESQGVVLNEGCGLQRYDVGEGLSGRRQPDQLLAGGETEGWVCFRGVAAGTPLSEMLFNPLGERDFWMRISA